MLIRPKIDIICDDDIDTKVTPDSIVAVKKYEGWCRSERGIVGDLISPEEAAEYEAIPFIVDINTLISALDNRIMLSYVDYIIAQGSTGMVDAHGSGVLHYFAANRFISNLENENGEAIQRLIEAGADPLLKNNTGYTPLFIAAEAGQLDAMKILILHEADRKEIFNGKTLKDTLPRHVQSNYDEFERGVIAGLVAKEMEPLATARKVGVKF